MEIFLPVFICVMVALLCGTVLTLTSHFLKVEENEKESALRDCLPGANCGACGFSGCDGYAKALSLGTTKKTNLCVPGGDHTAKELAAILGVEAEDVLEKVAYVACNGNCDSAKKKYDYVGEQSCKAANMGYMGDRYCLFACLGYGDCVKACPQNAISIVNGIAKVESSSCVGCGICVKACPNHLIHLVSDTVKVVVICSNEDKGAITRKNCTNGCIGCKKCEKSCPSNAIRVENNLARIDYTLCTGCKTCVEVCPVHCIHEGDFLSATHL